MSAQTTDLLSLIFGCISITMSIGIEAPQLYSIIKTKNTSGTSLFTYILFEIASFLWLTWATGFFLSNRYTTSNVPTMLHLASLLPAILSNSINVVLVSSILFLKIRYLLAAKRMHITELQLSQVIFDKHKGETWIKRYYPFVIVCLIALLVCISICLIAYFTYVPDRFSPEESEKYHMLVMIFNIIAASFFELTSWPQFIKCLRHKDTSGISLGWAIFFPLSCYVCFSYDLFLAIAGNPLDVIASLICSGSIINTLVLILKIRNVYKAKKLGISELEYTKRYIHK